MICGAVASSGSTPSGQRHIIARQVDPLESVAFLKIAQAAALFPIGEIRIDEILYAAVGAGTYAWATSAFVGALSRVNHSRQMCIMPACVPLWSAA